ncbi:MAG: NAD-dependent epimerase/dehydratase family protein [Dehalococcoidia bacterium]|nr:NAD-dependent epimerase/dehydratase family protein [Dehalococcoidia bacterium]
MQRALVTGGVGFIGSHVVDALVARGDSVAVLDVLSTGRHQNLNPKATLFQVDLRGDEVADALQSFHPDVVFHLGAQSSVVVSLRDPVQDAEINVVGTANLLRACVGAGVRKVVFASSGGTVYGEPDTLPCAEDQPLRPRSPYGASKVAGEALLQAFSASFGLSGTALRLPNVYGPRQDPNGEAGVIAIFGARMLRGEPVTIFGTGAQEKDYVYVEDVARAFLLASEEAESQVYNVGSGVGTSVNTLFSSLAHLTGYALQPSHEPARPGDVFKFSLDGTRLRQRLGWRIRVPLEEGLRKTLSSLRGS